MAIADFPLFMISTFLNADEIAHFHSRSGNITFHNKGKIDVREHYMNLRQILTIG